MVWADSPEGFDIQEEAWLAFQDAYLVDFPVEEHQEG